MSLHANLLLINHHLVNNNAYSIHFSIDCPFVKFNDSRSDLSVSNLRSTGANYITIVVTNFQDSIDTTTIYPTNLTATDDELTHVINYAHGLGLMVMLKPHIDLTKDPSHWRGDIGLNYNDQEWDEWFTNYNAILVHYAQMSQKLGVEQFSLGCELIATSPRDSQWRQVAASVRDVYDGKITYAANHGGEETNKTWWDVVDYIGVDAYYQPTTLNATLASLTDMWYEIMYVGLNNGIEQMTTSLYNLTVFWNKPMIFTEIGYCSGECTLGPGIDLGFQTEHFEAVFLAFPDLNWFHGVHWWNWASDSAFGGDNNWCMTPQFKPTEDLIRAEYGGTEQSVRPDYPPLCPCIL
ncbi:hypothetical protein DFA_05866 [Cavenderia fasciculata]|uniref:Glycoside hydrolase family 5 domain-containing protein n=1 Tax=Cavenderia fasciculata TaxID=261658 RepID=F4PN42_CACFS|nr:uncharacterized protein DFA_05866 [Cavenderia fasciculata]EGG23732.1 hypothetical protein DFA_05866 [Cavenderia fasciculata]|eukprot:XP_004361583.1 hypothetical protein DFA_05866 [Cavenderia fasciculata]